MTKYERGRQVEYAIAAFLRKHGYTVFRSAGSKGAFDLIAFNQNVIRLIQSKSSADDKYNYRQDEEKMSKIVVPPIATKELWIYVSKRGFVEIRTTNEELEYANGARITRVGYS